MSKNKHQQPAAKPAEPAAAPILQSAEELAAEAKAKQEADAAATETNTGEADTGEADPKSAESADSQKTMTTDAASADKEGVLAVDVSVCDFNAPEPTLPTYATDGSGCFDLYSSGVAHENFQENSITYRTNLIFAVPAGHVMLVFSRSGHGFKSNIRLSNCVGVIDSDYRGEVMVKLTRDNRVAPLSRMEDGERIAQALIVPIPKVKFNWVHPEDLESTERGANGFGSTGA